MALRSTLKLRLATAGLVAGLAILAVSARDSGAFFFDATHNAANTFEAGTWVDPLYLRGDTSPPHSLLSEPFPTATSLPNYDPGRDSAPGLLIAKGGAGYNESDSVKYHIWVNTALDVSELHDAVSLTFWSAVKDFGTEKQARVRAYLVTSDATGGNRTLLDSGEVADSNWGAADGSWEQYSIDFGTVTATVPANRYLALVLIVDGGYSADDLWFAYDTTTYTARLDFP